VGHVKAIQELKDALPNLEANIAKAVKAQAELDAAIKGLGHAKYYVTKN